jgi:hypothetical protein
MQPVVRRPRRKFMLALMVAASVVVSTTAAEARRRQQQQRHHHRAKAASSSAARNRLVSVQPVPGPEGPQLRATVTRLVRRKGFRVTNGVPQASGTGQYYTWAREAGLSAFVATELVPMGKRRRATFLVWSGHDGSVVGRWTVTTRAPALRAAVARGFWRNLGRAMARAQPPHEWRQLPQGPTLRIDASSQHDGDIVGMHAGRRGRSR